MSVTIYLNMQRLLKNSSSWVKNEHLNPSVRLWLIERILDSFKNGLCPFLFADLDGFLQQQAAQTDPLLMYLKDWHV